MKVVAIVNQKGGVGKTTTAINLATAIAAVPSRVLLVDIDPQGNTATGFGVNKQSFKNTANLYNALIGKAEIQDVIAHTEIPDLDIVYSDVNLAAAEIELNNLEQSRYRLKTLLSRIASVYDYVFIDCPPSIGLLTVNALVAAHSMLIPLQCEFFALEGVKHLLETYKLIKESLNQGLQMEGVVLTMYDRRNSLTELIEKDVRSCLGELVYKTVIPRNIALVEAQSYGKPALLYDINATGSVAYINMAKEFLSQQKVSA